MNRDVRKSVCTKVAGMAVTLAMLGLAALPVRAGCSDGASPASPSKAQSAGRFIPAVYQTGADSATFRTVGDEWFDSAGIVGLWEFEFHLDGAQNGLPDKTLFDWGLATWHEDGTEIQFSAGRTPSSGDVCMGVWRQVGHHEYKLHHIALGLTPPEATGTFIGPAIIRAEVVLDPSGDAYSGRYSVTIYPGSPTDGTEFNEKGTPLATYTGIVTAKRVLAH